MNKESCFKEQLAMFFGIAGIWSFFIFCCFYVASVFFYPAFFWSLLFTALLSLISGQVIEKVVFGYEPDFLGTSLFKYALLSIGLHLVCFSVTYVLVWVNIVNFEIEWKTLLTISFISVSVSSVICLLWNGIQKRYCE